MVQFNDGAVKAQLGTPDMRIPISLALSYPERIYLGGERLDFGKVKQLTFEAPDPKVFRNLALAYEALDKKGNVACVVNAANEVVVREFLNKKIGFLQMSDIIEQTMAKIAYIAQPTYEDYIQTDIEARKVAESFIK
jgi:1-deoxy-D-xylulose-5-phosphate reductoisomerase